MTAPATTTPQLFVVSAKTEKALLSYLHAYASFCETADEASLADICYTTCVAREHYRFRFACACSTLDDLRDHLKTAIADAEKTPLVAAATKSRIAFAFPGQGSQWQGMARALSDLDTRFCEILMGYARRAGAQLEVDLMPLLFEIQEQVDGKDAKSAINETHLSQACIFVFQCAMVAWLDSIGVRPNALVSHSLGEIAASGQLRIFHCCLSFHLTVPPVTSKAMSFETALDFVIVRANAMRPENTNGGLMAAVRSTVEPILERISALGLKESLSIAAYNADMQHVVSGEAGSVRTLVNDLSSKNVKATVLSVTQGTVPVLFQKILRLTRISCRIP